MLNIFSPIFTNSLTLKNRLVRSATNDNLGGSDGTITAREVELYRELAQNEVGLIISAHAYCEKAGRASEYQNSIDSDENLDILSKIAENVHQNNSRMIIQVSHAGAKAISENKVSPDTMTAEDFSRIKSAFVAASIRCQKAGMDGVQVHCAHGYLLSQFIDPATNHRTDCYGGSVENRFRFAREILDAIIEKCGKDFSVSIKINSNVAENDEAYEADLLEILKTCYKIGVDFAELSGFNTSTYPNGSEPYYLARAARMRLLCELPIALCGGIKTSAHAQALIDCGIDMVSVCRALIARPDFARQIRHNESSPCVSCRKCFTEILSLGRACVLHAPNSDLDRYTK